jgi:molybdenum cofactor cytidylyltransferase
MIVQVILAAGRGTRVGGNKGALVVAGKPLLTRLLDAAARSKIDETVVVVGAEAERVEPLCRRPHVRSVLNADFDRGQTSSLQTALRTLGADVESFLIHPVDHCLVGAADLDALIAARRATPESERPTRIFRPTFRGEWGHPVLYAAGYANEFLALEPDDSARAVYRRRLSRVVGVPVATDACLFDLDTPEDLLGIERRLAQATTRRRT